ncbi:MAG: RNA 2',3'-cyclic phosphodiesterase [Beijerinckiaceae bacterium]
MPRLFTGLEIPPDIAFELSMLRGGLSGARWIDPENYHVTLRFIGDVDNRTAREFAQALDEISAPEIEITLDVLDSFGGDKPRAVLARVRTDKALSELQADHERAARIVGCPPEPRKFVPHVTLARLRHASPLGVADWLSTRAMIRSLKFTAERFVLFSSRDSVGGGPYIVEADYPLSQYAH